MDELKYEIGLVQAEKALLETATEMYRGRMKITNILNILMVLTLLLNLASMITYLVRLAQMGG